MRKQQTAVKRSSVPFWHRHVHDWTTLAERYQPGVGDVEFGPSTARGAGAIEAHKAQLRLFERMAYGLTTVTQHCGSCGEQRSYTTTGDARTLDRSST